MILITLPLQGSKQAHQIVRIHCSAIERNFARSKVAHRERSRMEVDGIYPGSVDRHVSAALKHVEVIGSNLKERF
ncbi:hypothetical protein [Horticoccus sp. 23ND18S-11]